MSEASVSPTARLPHTRGVSAPAPYPFDAIPRVDPQHVALLRAGLRRLPPVQLGELLGQLEPLLGVRPELVVGSPHASTGPALAAAAADDVVALRLLSPRGPGAVLLALDARLAHVLVERTLGSDGDASAAPGPLLTPAQRGVLAYLGARGLAASGEAWTLAALTSGQAAFAALLPDAAVLRWPCELRVGATRGGVSAIWSDRDSQLFRPADARFEPLAALPISCSVVVGRATLTAATCRGLSPGDILVLDEARVDANGDGRAVVSALGASTPRYECELEAGTLRLTTIDRPAPRATTKGASMASDEPSKKQGGDTATAPSRPSPKPDGDALRGAAGDAPVELAVEMARIELPLSELAGLRCGEIVVCGVPTRGPVTLRAGGRAVATGELVDVDGELGVRILELAD